MTIAQQADSGPTLLDNEVLDEWEVPFGDWIDQSVDWIDNNLGWLLNAIEWPFTFLLDNLVDNFLAEISWLWVVLGFLVLGSLVRGVKVGLFAAGALGFCGILGNAYWIETARTIGFIGVAVLLCVLIGIPIGVACGRIDGVWGVIRPILDAMQVVHSFVYMLPFIFFFGIGEEAATMVTMVFALPPLIRLTNLGIRQVPEDVVEAARAYGAPEWRVLADVQLPLARPAIMTGLNQTLLLAISMLGIAAIMGAGGLGRLLFRAISNLDVALANSAGLAFFLVAVVLDRISQPEAADSGGLLTRIRAAWAHRRDPEALLEASTSASAPVSTDGEPAAVAPNERLGLLIAVPGAALALIALILPWSVDSGRVSSHARLSDLDLAGSSFNGIAGAGGSWHGLIVLGMAVWLLAAAGDTLFRQSRHGRYLSPDGALIASIAIFAAALAYLVTSPSNDVAAHSLGIGVIVAVVGGVVAMAGAGLAMWNAPFAAKRPLSLEINWTRIFGVAVALLILAGATFSGWSFDARAENVIGPELQEELDALEREAELNAAVALQNANIIQNKIAEARRTDRVINDSWTERGPQLGWLVLLLGALALLVALPAAGVFGTDDIGRWRWSVLAVGIGVAIQVVAVGWIASVLRVSDPGLVSGVGAFLALIGGFFTLASARLTMTDFTRSRVYEHPDIELDQAATAAADDAVDTVKAEAVSTG